MNYAKKKALHLQVSMGTTSHEKLGDDKMLSTESWEKPANQ